MSLKPGSVVPFRMELMHADGYKYIVQLHDNDPVRCIDAHAVIQVISEWLVSVDYSSGLCRKSDLVKALNVMNVGTHLDFYLGVISGYDGQHLKQNELVDALTSCTIVRVS